MKAADLMTHDPACVTPTDSARDAARLMEEWDCGLVPVVDDLEQRRVLGVITDRDLALRVLADGRPADVAVGELMTGAPDCVTADADVERVERLMADRQVRRIVVIDDDGRAIGVIAQADLARASREMPREVSQFEVAQTLERISVPDVDARADEVRDEPASEVADHRARAR